MFFPLLRDLRKIGPATFLLISPNFAAADQSALVFDTAIANFRSGPDVKNRLKAVFKEGDRVGVEQLTGDWYMVSKGDEQNGYIYKNLLKLTAESAPQPIAPAPPAAAPVKTKAAETKVPTKEPTPTSAVPTPVPAPSEPAKTVPPPASKNRVDPLRATDTKSQSILQMLEGHETEVKIGLIIAAIFFAIGWLCGGAFYARRERRSRYKLRF